MFFGAKLLDSSSYIWPPMCSIFVRSHAAGILLQSMAELDQIFRYMSFESGVSIITSYSYQKPAV
jgi:hypothetical protein